jgi:hypothetical protein
MEVHKVFTHQEYYELIDELLEGGATAADLEEMGWNTYEGWVKGITGGRENWPVAHAGQEELDILVQDLNNYHNKEEG